MSAGRSVVTVLGPPPLGIGEIMQTAVPFALPLAVPFRGTTEREGVLVRGPSGYGEFAPFDDYDDEAAARWLACAVEAAWGTWPDPVRTTVPTNAIIPALPAAEAAAMAYRAVWSFGCQTVKVKVGQPESGADGEMVRTDVEAVHRADVERLVAIRAALDAIEKPRLNIRIDANAAWDAATAAAVLPELDAAARGVQFVEQPCAELDDIALLRESISMPIALDESIRTVADPAPALALADIVVLKAGPVGGVARGLAIAAQSRVPVVVSGAMDSAIGLDAGLALAAAVPSLTYDCGLGTGTLLAEDLLDSPLVPRGGVLQVARHSPDRAALRQAKERISPDRAAWWLARLEQTWDHGGAEMVAEVLT